MKRQTIWTCNDYCICRVGVESLHDIADFVVQENYKHHKVEIDDARMQNEANAICCDELLHQNNSFYFAAYNPDDIMIGCIRVFKWDKITPIPMQRIFNISPIEAIENLSNTASFWHIGRFAVNFGINTPSISLFKQLMLLAVAPIVSDQQDSYMLAEVDRHLLRVMNALGIETTQIGKGRMYLASETIPIYSDKMGLSKFYVRCRPLLCKT